MKTVTALVLLAFKVGALAASEAVLAPDVDAVTIPRLLSYQGKLTDNLGNPVTDTTYSVSFRLYTVASGGTAFWNETQTVRTKAGLFAALLGSVTPVGAMPDAGAVYLGMAVAGGAELTPRLRIASAAYAYLAERAASADLLQGKDTTALDARYVNEAQANSVTSTMITDATIAAADLGQMGASAGQVMKWTGSAWQPRNDSVGGSGGGGSVTSVSQATGIVCTPNPITGTGTVGFDQAYGDGRYINEAQASGGDLTGTYPNPTIAANAVGSAEVLDGSLRGVDLALPCTLSYSGAASCLRVNSTAGAGVAAYSQSGHGVHVTGAGANGVEVDRAGEAGIHVTRAQTSGIEVDTAAGWNGVEVSYANHHGVQVDSTGWSGVAVNRASYHGLHVSRANAHGIYIQRARKDGVHVLKADSLGIQVDTATQAFRVRLAQEGLVVDSVTYDAISINATGDDGIYVNRPRYGVWLINPAYWGVYVNNAGYYGCYANSDVQAGGYFRNNNNSYYALTAWNNTGTGGTVRGLYVQGHGYATGGWQTYLDGGTTGYGVVSPDMEIMASGSGQLSGGRASVTIEKTFRDAVSASVPLKVIVTPNQMCNGVCVTSRSADGFSVAELADGKSDAGFDWIAIGRLRSGEQRPQVTVNPAEMQSREDARQRREDAKMTAERQQHPAAGLPVVLPGR
jgi:ribosomal protein L13E